VHGDVARIACSPEFQYCSRMNSKRANPAPAERPPAAPDRVMFSLLRAAHALEERLEAAMSAVDLSMAKYGALSQLARANEPLPLSEMASRLSCVRSNMTQLVDRLESDGLVRRVDDPSDRRSVRAELTALGRERYAAGTRQLAKVQAEFGDAMGAADRKVLERALSALE
jgi:DNA-binding MarR family transcriptional regulator